MWCKFKFSDSILPVDSLDSYKGVLFFANISYILRFAVTVIELWVAVNCTMATRYTYLIGGFSIASCSKKKNILKNPLKVKLMLLTAVLVQQQIWRRALLTDLYVYVIFRDAHFIKQKNNIFNSTIIFLQLFICQQFIEFM